VTESLFIIDGHSQIFRAYFSPAARRRTVRGKPVGAVYIFTRMLQKLIKDYKPDYMVCVLDPHGETFRNEIYPEYKATRDEMPEDLRDQIPIIEKLVHAFDIPLVVVPRYEADDVIATLACLGAAEGLDVRIVSKDKDLKQLLSERVCMINHEDGSLYGVAELHAELGITPLQFIDAQALAGDTVDNVPGAKGIGLKTAAELLKEFGTLDEILKQAENIKQPKRRENLIAYRPEAEISRKLVYIRPDVPGVKLDKKAAKYHLPEKAKLLPMLVELNFKSVAQDFGWGDEMGSEDAPDGTKQEPTTGSDEEAPAKPKPAKPAKPKGQGSLFGDTPAAQPIKVDPALLTAGADYTLVNDAKTFEVFLKATNKAKRWAIHFAAEENAPVAGFALATEPGKAWYLPLNSESLSRADALDALGVKLGDAKVAKIGHDLKQDARLLRKEGMYLRGIESDTKLVAFLIDGSREDAKLASLSREYLGLDTINWDKLFGDKKGRVALIDAPPENVMAYAAQYADYALRVSDALTPQLKTIEMEQLASDLEFPLIEVLAEMEHKGIRIDKPYLAKLSKEMEKDIGRLEKECYKHAGGEFSIGSPKQLGEVLFDRLKLPAQGKTAKGTGLSTDQSVLETLAPMHPLPATVLEWRHLSKLKSTFVDQLIELADKEDRVHTTYRQTVATGRLSSKDPNLQNIPVRTEEGKKIRRGFIASKGMKLISADYSQIELRILAHIADEKHMIEAFKKGIDIHKATAAGILGIKPETVTPEQRNMAKTVNYAVLYGQSAFGLSQGLNIPRAEAKAFIDNYFNSHPKVAKLNDQVLEECRKVGYVKTVAGRKRYLPEITSKNVMVRKQAERQAFNTVLQGTAADLIKKAMLDAHREIEKKKLPYRMLLQVHDELVFEAPEKEAKACAEFAREVMSKAMKLKVPLDVDAGIGDNWLEAK
jgi:DNA polymerase-1